MNAEIRSRKKTHSFLITGIVFVLAFDLAFAWQRRAGAYASELGGHSDEAAHYVTGLMAHDYLVRGFFSSPLKFADEFNRHYPEVELRGWPPVFHAVEAAWMLPFGESKTSVLLLMCALAGIVGTLLFRALHEEFGAAPAAIATALFLSLPLVREYYSLVMSEMLISAVMFAATLAFGRYIDREKSSDILSFGLLAAIAIMTKGSGLALTLVVPISLLLTGKWHLFARPSFWGAVVLTALLAGPWILHFRNIGQLDGSWSSWSFTPEALPYYVSRLGVIIGVFLALFMIVGFGVKLLRPAERTGRWSALAALTASVVIFQAIVPAGLEPRHLLPALPAALMFGVVGCAFLVRRFEVHADRALTVVLSVVAALTIVLFEFVLPVTRTKEWSGFKPLAHAVLDDKENPGGRVLVASDASGEGMFIAEIASAEKRPGHAIERATKVLAETESSRRRYRSKFSDHEELMDFLLDQNLNYIVLDDSVPDLERGAYHDMLKRVLIENTERFWEVGTAPIVRGSVLQETPIRLYRVQARKILTR